MKLNIFITICWISIISLVFPTDEVKLQKKPKCDDKTQDKNRVENKRTTAFEVAKNLTTFEKEKPKYNGQKQNKNCMKKKRTKASEFAENPTTFEKEKPKCNGQKQNKNCMKKKRTKASEFAENPTTFEKEKPKCNGQKQNKNCMKKKRAVASEFSTNPAKFEKNKAECGSQPLNKCIEKLRSTASKAAYDSRANKKDNLGNIITEEVNESLKQKKYQQQLFLCHVNEKLKKRWKHCLRGDEKTLHARKKYLESINDKPEAFNVTTYLNIN
ncbi:unnamed protein product [Schistosoma rodhaini]|uniref:Uncharacterized protein n=1 Tax=Schistosoma rodhaini TaxID=6188 RepID=A0AA85EVI9_9TREM|nr:unnamed protein product [Schistosoma rodhaini]